MIKKAYPLRVYRISLKLVDQTINYNFTEIEQRILFWLISYLRKKENIEEIKLCAFKTAVSLEHLSISTIEKYLYSMNKKIESILLNEKNNENETLSLFKVFEIKEYYLLVDEIYGKYLNIQKNEEFESYFVVEKPYTQYRYADYLKMKGKYSKRFLLLFMTYRKYGQKEFKMDIFKEKMGFPKSYRMTNITKYLNESIEENKIYMATI